MSHEASPVTPRRRLLAARLAPGLTVALVALSLLAPLWAELHKVGGTQEEGFMLALPDLVLRGRVPHRDFAWLYGPGSAWMPAAAYRLFGTDLLVGRLVGLAYQATTVASVFALGLRWNRAVATAASLLAVLFLSTRGLTPLPWDAALALSLAALALCGRALDGSARRAGRWAFAAGLLGGLVLVVRPDFVVGVAGAAFLVGRALPRGLRRSGALGLGTGFAPWLIHLATAGPGPVWRGLVVDPAQLRASNRMPLPPDPGEVQGFIEKFINFDEPPWPLPRLGAAAQLTAWFFLLGAGLVVVVIVAWWARRRADPPRAASLAGLAALGVGLLPGVLQRADASHLSSFSPLVLPAVIFALTELAGPGKAPAGPRSSVLTGGGVLLLVCAVAPTWSAAAYLDDTLVGLGARDLSVTEVHHRGRAFRLSPSVASDVRGVLEAVEGVTEQGDRLFVGPLDLRRTPYNDSFFYHLLPQLEPATKFVYLNPAVALHQGARLARDVASADVLVLSAQWSAWDEPNDSRLLGPDTANEVVRTQFCEVVRPDTRATESLFSVFTRCDAPRE